MDIKNQFLNLGSFIVKNGTQVRFWEDKWLGDQPLKYKFPSLFNIVWKENATVAKVLSSLPPNLSFRRALTGNKLTEWYNLVLRTMNVDLTEGNDVFRWKLHSNGSFSVRSMYKHLISNNIRVSQDIWLEGIEEGTKIVCFVALRKRFNISFLIVLLKGTHWLRIWTKLQRSEERTQFIVEGCRRMETVVLQVFGSFGWPSVARISF
ncbi:hypothetical protein U9M48_000488 [Paspalum notatum var. saurae]|uniref:Reverse transcriptase zinc-binding domain-containing protein n=1 Tax=Paspalum notatum var. saurae TaxID=547442 RepID=A0AAQ3PFA0_PASNO